MKLRRTKINPREKNDDEARYYMGGHEDDQFPFTSSRMLHGETETMTKMEKSFGTDFSDVKIHKDSTQAGKLNAKAFTVGKNIHFAPGQYNPHSKEGQELIGHELTHIVQQKQDKIGTGEIHGKGLVINNDSTLEKEADDAGKSAAQGNEVDVGHSNMVASNTIQRFEAKGHEAAERTALSGDNTFSDDEASMVYYGNWMRDMNQALVPALAKEFTPDVVFSIIDYLGYQKFGRLMNSEEFGYYIPAEHIDNPGGQLPDKDYYSALPNVNKDLYDEKDRFDTNKWDPRPENIVTPQASNDPTKAEVVGEKEQGPLEAGIFSVDQSGVMAYIRRTNLHVENRLKYAAMKRRTPEGMMHLGAALHAVEDLFAHSNFVEIALDKLLHDDPNVLPELEKENRYVRKLSGKVDNTLTPAEGDTMPVLTTGTFTSMDTLQSVGAEAVNMLRKGLNPPATEHEKRAQKAMMRKIVHAVDRNPALKEKVGNLPIAETYDALEYIALYIDLPDYMKPVREYFNAIFTIIADELDARGLVTKVQDTPLYRAEREVDKTIAAGGENYGPMTELKATLTGKEVSPAAIKKDAEDYKTLYNNTPEKVMVGASHSQLSKDHANSVFFGLAFRLAVEADKLIRDEMLKIWGNEKFIDPDSEILSKNPDDLKRKKKNDYYFSKQRHDQYQETREYGQEIYETGHADGQKYDLQAIRDQAAKDISSTADLFITINNSGANNESLLVQAEALLGFSAEKLNFNSETKDRISNTIKNAHEINNDFIEQNKKNGLLDLAKEFTEIAAMVKNAKTLQERELAYQKLLIAKENYVNFVIVGVSSKDPKFYEPSIYLTMAVVIDKELAAVAPAYPMEQIDLLEDVENKNPQERTDFKLPPLLEDNYKQLLTVVRMIMNHPYATDWWKSHMLNYINNPTSSSSESDMTNNIENRHKQLIEEIRARNAGYAHFAGNPHSDGEKDEK